MQQKEQEPQESMHGAQTTEQPEQERKPDSTTISAQTEQQLAEVQQKAAEYLDLLRRTQADFINYRNRISKEQAEERIVAQSMVLSQLLPILDDFRLALDAVPPELANHPWVQGISIIVRRLPALLDQLGVRQIGAPGEPFDPYWHEAISTEARPDIPEGTIVYVVKPGYILGERVIRPAQVIVSSHAPSNNEGDEPPMDRDTNEM
jgi:molecular chaperone GrpE